MTFQEFEQELENAYQEIMQPVCPGPTTETVSGFSRYQNTVASLSNSEHAKIKRIAGLIIRSVRLSCPSILTVELTGHADFDPLRERREPGFMYKISLERALAVKKALERLLNNTAISRRVVWNVLGAAATRLAVPNPRNEQERRLNRRVEVSFRAIDPVCITQTLGTSIALDRPIRPEQRDAIRRFQQRQGLALTGSLTLQTVASLIRACGFTTCSSDATAMAKLPHPALNPRNVLRWYEGTGVRVSADNWAVPYIYGRCAFEDIADALATARDANHRVYILGWWVDPNTKLVDGTPPLVLRDLLSVIKAQIRGMFWDDPDPTIGFADNRPIVSFLNSLPNGAAILDHKLPFVRFAGAQTEFRAVHHQKLLVVSGASGLMAFTGGIDINNTRINVSSGGDEPLHDVHVRVTGEAAKDLFRVFSQRWMDHPDTPALEASRFKLSPQDVAADFNTILRLPSTKQLIRTSTEAWQRSATPSHAVGIGRTYANLLKFTRNEAYSFAPSGEQTAWRLIANGVRNAQRFIYIEDQYFVSRRLKAALLSKIRDPQFQSLIILTQQSSSFEHDPSLLSKKNEFPFLIAARNEIRTDFSSVDPRRSKWRIFFLKPATESARQQWCGGFVHSKTLIFDDECAIIGSANADDRGYTFDTEVVACITDDPVGRMARQRFARDLRVNLWHKHLAVPQAQLLDWNAAMRFWIKPPIGAMIVDGSELEDSPLLGPKPILRDISSANQLWQQTIDPDADLLP